MRRQAQVVLECGVSYSVLWEQEEPPQDGQHMPCPNPTHMHHTSPATFTYVPGEDPALDEPVTGFDPLAWLTDKLTLMHGSPSIRPPERSGIAAMRDPDGLLWVNGPGAPSRRRWNWEPSGTGPELIVDKREARIFVHMTCGQRQAAFATGTNEGYPEMVVLQFAARYVYHFES